MTQPTALITGATSGIGRATAEIFGKNKYRLILCGRNEDRLNEISKSLKKYTEIITLKFDVRDRDSVLQSIGSLSKKWMQIDILVNNAGNAHGLSPIHEGNLDDWDAMIDTNVKGLLYVTKAIIPGMVKRKSGHVVNIGSIAGKEVYLNGNVYSASKFAVDAINNGMRLDLNKHGVKVSQVCPGLVETDFSMVRFKGDKERSKSVYSGFDALKAEDIADIIYFIVSRPFHVNVSDITVLAGAQASATIVNRDQ